MTIRDEVDFDGDIDDTNEDVNDSETNNDEGTEDDTSKVTPPADDTADDATSKSYRPSTEEKEQKIIQTVPLKKFLDLKKELKELRESGDNSDLSKQTLEDFAEDSGLQIDTVKKLAKIIIAQATEEATRVADERVKPIVQEKMSQANMSAFEQDFQKSIVSKYPELANKIETFKRIAFSKDFIHLKNLEEIKNEFYPEVKAATQEVKKTTVEAGSQGGNKETETVEFAKLKDNPAQYEKVMKDPIARAKYYEWQDSSV